MIMQRHPFMVRFGYLGHRFHGVQLQGRLPTVALALSQRIEQAAHMPPRSLCFAARTDRLVNAVAAIATFWLPARVDIPAFLQQLQQPRNDGLLHVQGRCCADIHVHARGCAMGKRYRYVVQDNSPLGSAPNPLVWQIAPCVDVARMRVAARSLVGRHNFQSFRAAGCCAASPIKTLQHITIGDPIALPQGRRQIWIELQGDSFLRKMVRIVVGLLVEVGIRLREPADVATILQQQNRRCCGVTAPAHGLSLLHVMFPAWQQQHLCIAAPTASKQTPDAPAAAAGMHHAPQAKCVP